MVWKGKITQILQHPNDPEHVSIVVTYFDNDRSFDEKHIFNIDDIIATNSLANFIARAKSKIDGLNNMESKLKHLKHMINKEL